VFPAYGFIIFGSIIIYSSIEVPWASSVLVENMGIMNEDTLKFLMGWFLRGSYGEGFANSF